MTFTNFMTIFFLFLAYMACFKSDLIRLTLTAFTLLWPYVGFLHRVVVKCSAFTEEGPASIFKVTELFTVIVSVI
jgi:hypothetical protein